MLSISRGLAVGMLVATTPSLLPAQDDRPEPTGTAKLITINAMAGGFAAGIVNAASGRSFWPAFAKGAAGGVIAFGGKKIIAERGAFASWTGRQVAAVGSSQVRNAGAGRPMMEQLVFPLGPARLYFDRKAHTRIAAKIDVTAAIGIVAMATRPGASFDPAGSVSHGAIVFNTPWPADNSAGALRLGVIRISEIPEVSGGSRVARSSVLAHELIHAAQYDFINITASEPLERWALGKSRTGKLIQRYVDFSSVSYLWTGLNGILENDERPWEREAISLAPGYEAN